MPWRLILILFLSEKYIINFQQVTVCEKHYVQYCHKGKNQDAYNTANDDNDPLREDHEKEGCEEKGKFKCIKERGINVLDIIIRYNFNNPINEV